MPTASSIIKLLGLKPHKEGGHFAEVWRAPERLAVNALPPRYSGSRSLSTAIYYLITPESFSRMHRLRSDELFHFYLGDPVEFLLLEPEDKGAGRMAQGAGRKAHGAGQDGNGHVVTVGSDLSAGHRPMLAVRRGAWQGARLVEGGKYALLGTTMAPGFEYEDYEEGDRGLLVRGYPAFEKMICALTS